MNITLRDKNQWEEPFHIYKGQWRLIRETAYDMRKWRVRRLGTLPSSATYNMFDELHWILYRKRHRGNNNRNLASSSSGIWTALSFPFFPSLPSYDIIQKKDKASSCFSSAAENVSNFYFILFFQTHNLKLIARTSAMYNRCINVSPLAGQSIQTQRSTAHKRINNNKKNMKF